MPYETSKSVKLNKADTLKMAQRAEVDPVSIVDFRLNIEHQRRNIPDLPSKSAELGKQLGFGFVQDCQEIDRSLRVRTGDVCLAS